MINIIGAGLAGSIMAKILRKEGIEFRIYDSRKTGAASQVSENLIGLNWYSSIADRRDEAFKILQSIVKWRYMSGPDGSVLAIQIDRNEILEKDVIIGNAEITDSGVIVNGEFHRGFNIICTGVWDKSIGVKSLVGLGMEFQGQTPAEFIRPYRPYRQEKLVNVSSDKYWYAQSLAVTDVTFFKNADRFKSELITGAKAHGINIEGHELKYGFRPKRFDHEIVHSTNAIHINGGFKSGLINYPIQCRQALDFIKKNNL